MTCQEISLRELQYAHLSHEHYEIMPSVSVQAGKGPEKTAAVGSAAVKQVLEKVKSVSVQKVFFHNSIVRPLFPIRML
jgi:hypothetical protein